MRGYSYVHWFEIGVRIGEITIMLIGVLSKLWVFWAGIVAELDHLVISDLNATYKYSMNT